MKEKLTFRQAQLAAYEVLKKLDEICRRENITYFLFYGTLIGAIRNQGIIPWDDDIDTAMPRPDYDRFISYCQTHREELFPYKLFENSINPDYPHTIARFSDQRYDVEFANEKNYGLGIFVDIYPLDGVGKDMAQAQKLIHRCYPVSSFAFLTSRKHFGRDNTRSNLKMILKFPVYLWARMMGNAHYMEKSRKVCSQCSWQNSDLCAIVAAPVREKPGQNRNVFCKEWMEPVEVAFEDGRFMVPKGYDPLLKMIYGDYMTPPDENHRQPQHTFDVWKKL